MSQLQHLHVTPTRSQINQQPAKNNTMDFDADRIYYSHQNLHQQQDGDGQPGQQQSASRLEDEEERAVDSDALRRHFREFLRKLVGT